MVRNFPNNDQDKDDAAYNPHSDENDDKEGSAYSERR